MTKEPEGCRTYSIIHSLRFESAKSHLWLVYLINEISETSFIMCKLIKYIHGVLEGKWKNFLEEIMGLSHLKFITKAFVLKWYVKSLVHVIQQSFKSSIRPKLSIKFVVLNSKIKYHTIISQNVRKNYYSRAP